MAYNTFPNFAGRGWGIKKRPITRTLIQQADSGAEYRTQRYQYPLYEFDVEIPYLTQSDSDTLIGFYNQQGGPFQPFYFSADNDNSVTSQPIGTTDGTTTQYQLTKSNGSYWNEPIAGVQGTPAIFRTDWQGNQLLYSTARTNYLYPSDAVASWSKNSGITGAAATAFTGTSMTPQLLTNSGSANSASVSPTGASGSSGTTCAWVVLETASSNKSPLCLLRLYDTTAGAYVIGATLNLSSGATTKYAGSGTFGATVLSNSGPNGGTVYLLWVSGNIPNGHASSFAFFPTSDGMVAGSVIVHCAQIEAGTSPKGYIPTTSAAVTVTDYTLSPSGALAIANPTAGAVLTWTGQYYYLLRFKDDQIETTQTLSQIYEATTLTLRSVR